MSFEAINTEDQSLTTEEQPLTTEEMLESIREMPAFKALQAKKKMFPNQVACARDYSMLLPSSPPKKLALIRIIAESLQKEKGHFLFEEAYKVLEESYGEESLTKENMLDLLEDWVDNNLEVENLGTEGDFHAYKLKQLDNQFANLQQQV